MKPTPLPLALLWATPALAQTSGEPGVSTGTYVQLMLGLVLILGLLWATAYFARNLLGGKGFGQGGLKLLGGVALGPKERIVLLEAGDTWLVVGIVPGQIRTLHTLPKGQLPGDGQEGPENLPFSHWLKQFKDRHGRPQ